MNTPRNSHDASLQETKKQPTPAYDLPSDADNGVIAASPTANAAKGDDALMSQPTVKEGAAKEDVSKGTTPDKRDWKLHVSAARSTWNKISEDELVQSKGSAGALGALVEKRYGIKRPEADAQVKRFFSQQHL